MAEDFQLSRSLEDTALSRSLFRPRFADPGLEAAWMVERLDAFRRVNRRAMWVCVLTLVTFFVADLLMLGSSFEVMVTRTLFILFSVAMLVGVGKVRAIWVGDAFVLVAGTATLAVMWFHIFMKLPTEVVASYWMIGSALSMILVLVLIEAMLSARIFLAMLVLAITMSAPLALNLGMPDVLLSLSHLLLVLIVGWIAAWQVEIARRLAFARQLAVESERERTVELLRNILPVSIADRLLSQPGTIAERHTAVTVLFADIVGFTPWASSCEADQVVEVLDQIFSAFDDLCDEHGVEKIKTIGDAYMAAGGVPEGGNGAADNVVRLALSMLEVVNNMPLQGDSSLRLRIGIHQGPVVAGVIGRRKFIYDLWGDTVNTAARMESHGVPGLVQITEAVAEQLGDDFEVEPRGVIEVKGKGPMKAFLVGTRPNA